MSDLLQHQCVCVFSPVIMLAVLTAVFPLGRLADPATRDWSFTMGTSDATNINNLVFLITHFDFMLVMEKTLVVHKDSQKYG